jgi:hypothetical protein
MLKITIIVLIGLMIFFVGVAVGALIILVLAGKGIIRIGYYKS